jgi:hypothetical protein
MSWFQLAGETIRPIEFLHYNGFRNVVMEYQGPAQRLQDSCGTLKTPDPGFVHFMEPSSAFCCPRGSASSIDPSSTGQLSLDRIRARNPGK